MEWIRNDKLSIEGTSLIRKLIGVTNEQIKNKFGKLPKGLKQKYSETIVLSNDSEEIIPPKNPFFDKEAKGIYTLYCNFGEWRIGGYDNNSFVDQLEEYIRS